MRRALAIPDLLATIMHEMDRSTQATANLVCKNWRGTAVGILWGDNVVNWSDLTRIANIPYPEDIVSPP